MNELASSVSRTPPSRRNSAFGRLNSPLETPRHERLQDPACVGRGHAVNDQRVRHRALRDPAVREHDVRGRQAEPELHCDVRVAFQGPADDHVGHQQLAQPPQERPPSRHNRARGCSRSVDRRGNPQRRFSRQRDRGVVGGTRVAVVHHRRRQRAVVEAHRHERFGAAGDSRGCQAVERSTFAREHPSFPGPRASRSERTDRMLRLVRLERRQPRCRHENREADVLELRKMPHRFHRFDPAIERHRGARRRARRHVCASAHN